MKKHIKTYVKFFGYGEQDLIPSELSGKRSNDCHHIIPKSQGGTDNIENLIALTRHEHDAAHHLLKDFDLNQGNLILIHRTFIAAKRPDYKFDEKNMKKTT
jgi:5-methylcytosine-specific restriction endonuclease McrA